MLHSPELSRPFHVVDSDWPPRANSASAPLERGIAALPVVTYRAGETVVTDGSRTGRFLILKKGAVAIAKEDTEIARVTEPGAVFGEFAVLLDQPNKMDVRALEPSQFYVGDAAVLLAQNPVAVHVARTLARQLDNANDLQMNRALPWLS